MAQTKVKLISDGVIDVNHLASGHSITTDNIGEGSNLYYTDARVSTYLSTNNYATEGFVTTAVSNLVDAAPSTLDTLNELAAALGDDPNFATTVTNSIAAKLPLTGGNITGNFSVDTNTLYVDAASNNIGIGVAPRTSSVRTLEMPNWVLEDNGAFGFKVNAYYDGSNNVFINNGKAARLYSDDGYFAFFSSATGNAGGTVTFEERMRIDSDGNVGVGTNSPSAKLHIGDGTTSVFQRFNSTNGGAINFQKSGTNSAFIGEVQQGLGSGDGLLLYTYSGGDRPIRFYPGGFEKVRFAQNGNVGIGTTSPTAKLDVNSGATNVVAALRSTDEGAFIAFADNTTSLDAGYPTSSVGVKGDNLVFNTNNSEKVRINSTGDLSIANGQQSTNATGAEILLGNRGYYSSPYIGAAKIASITGSSNWYSGTSLAFYTNPGPDVTSRGSEERVRITSAGNVGIGTISPTTELHIAASKAGNVGISVQNTNSSYSSQIRFLDSTGTEKSALTFVPSDTSLRFFHNGSDRIFVKSDGNVGIGATSLSSGAKLDVNGHLSIANGSQINLTRTLNTNNLWYGMRYSSDEVQIYTYDASNRSITFNTADGTNVLSGQLMKIQADGKVGIGTSSPFTKTHIYDTFDPDDTYGYLLVENGNTTSGSASTNAAVNVKNYHGTSQFMQWEENGLRFGSRITANGGGGNVYITSGNDNVAMTVSSGGSVGIGTTAPDAKLEVAGRIYSAGEAGQRTYTPRHFLLGHPGNTGNFTRSINVVTDIGQSLQGGIVQLIVHTWQNEHQFGLITWNNAGGSGPIINAAYTSISSQGNLGISVAVNGSVDNQIDITFTNAHSNSHGWQAYVMGLY